MLKYCLKMSLLFLSMSSIACTPPSSQVTTPNTDTNSNQPIDKQLPLSTQGLGCSDQRIKIIRWICHLLIGSKPRGWREQNSGSDAAVC